MKKRKKRINLYPVIGKYIDTPTKAELNVMYFIDDLGSFKIALDNLPSISAKGCRIQVKHSQAKSKKKFYRKLQSFIDLSNGWRSKTPSELSGQVPLLFGLLKLRKNKLRRFVLFQAADLYPQSKVVNIIAVGIDNLLYMDLVNRLKKTA